MLTESKKDLNTQAQAASHLGISERQVRRLLRKLRAVGDRAVVHGLRGRRPIVGSTRTLRSAPSRS